MERKMHSEEMINRMEKLLTEIRKSDYKHFIFLSSPSPADKTLSVTKQELINNITDLICDINSSMYSAKECYIIMKTANILWKALRNTPPCHSPTLFLPAHDYCEDTPIV